MLAAIRNYLIDNETAPIIVESIEHEFLTTIDRSAGERVPRLRLNVDDNAFFQSLIGRDSSALPEPARESHDKLVAASQIASSMVRRILGPYAQENRVAALNDWLEFIEHNASVILLKAPDGSQAFRMFETLNDRGLKTSQVDLVKSYLFGQASKRITEAQSKWSSMRSILEELDDEESGINFLRHSLIATREFTRADEVYSKVHTAVRGETNSISFLSDLESLSRTYVATFRPDADQWVEYPATAIEALKILNKFNIKPLRPLVISIARTFSAQEANKAFQYLVSLSVRLLIASTTRSGTIEETIAAAALDVFNKEIVNTKGLRSKLSRIAPDDKPFRDSFAIATISKADYARYYLRKLENAVVRESEPWTTYNEDSTQITLEHILPKSAEYEHWPTFEPDTASRWARRIGNLCLLQKTTNSNARSDSFSSKRSIYKDSPYFWTNSVAEHEEWTPEAIEARQARMAEVAIKAWPL